MTDTPYVGLELRELASVLEARAHAVKEAKRGIDTAGMTRPPRDPFESRWLAAHGQLGPFREAPDAGMETHASNPPSPGVTTQRIVTPDEPA